MKINAINPYVNQMNQQQVKVAKKEATNNVTVPNFQPQRVPAEYACSHILHSVSSSELQ